MIPGIPQGQEYRRDAEAGIRKDQECMADIKKQDYQRNSNIWQILRNRTIRGTVIYGRY
jgi:hypothetical protein